MAFIIFSDREGEFDRRELVASITIGRSPQCDVPVRDMLLSRVHCRIEPHGQRWVLIDSGSMNGTRICEELIGRHILENGDVLRIGRTYVCFRDGRFIRPKPEDPERRTTRPLDPSDALSTTVAGVELKYLEEESPVMGLPTPQPKPAEPRAYRKEGVGFLVAKMASGVWDTRTLNELPARRAARKLPSLPVGTWEEPSMEEEIHLRKAISRATREIARLPLMREINHSMCATGLSPAEQARRRHAASSQTGSRSRRWLVVAYLTIAWIVFATSMYTLAWQFF